MKLSVSVPDDLWERVGGPRASPSQLIQTALQRMLETELARPPFVDALPDVSEELFEARAVLVVQARASFESGYRHAVSAAKEIPWSALNELDNVRWDLAEWLEEWQPGPPDFQLDDDAARWLRPLGEHLGQMADPSRDWRPGDRTYLRGFTQGLHDVWDAVEHAPVVISEQPGAEVLPPQKPGAGGPR